MASDATIQIGGQGSSAAPLDYVVPSAEDLAILAVSATFDGTSAAGDFQPCVQIITDSGHLLASCPGSTVTAGDSAEVTFAPFLRQATTAAPSTVTRYAGVYNGNSVTIADGSSDQLTLDTWTGGDNVLNIGNPIFPQPTKTGNWLFAVNVFVGGAMTIGGSFLVELDVIGLGNGTSVGMSAYDRSPLSSAVETQPRVTAIGFGWLDSTSPTTKISINVTNNDGSSAQDFSVNQCLAQFLGGP